MCFIAELMGPNDGSLLNCINVFATNLFCDLQCIVSHYAAFNVAMTGIERDADMVHYVLYGGALEEEKGKRRWLVAS